LISNHIISSYGSDLNAKVADLICENNWIWSIEWSELFSEVIDVPVPVLSSDFVDKALWFNKKNEEVYCKDSHSYLFFQCGFAQGIWDRLKLMCRLEDLSYVWAEIVSVRLRLLGLKIKRSHEVEKAAAIWKIPIKGVGEKSGVLYGAFLGLELWIITWERRLLFSVLVLVITPCFGEVGWGRFGFHIWDEVIRECRVEKSNVPVLTHRFVGYAGFVGSGGIRGVRLCSDKRRLSRFPLVDSGFVRISPWEGCKPGLDVFLWSVRIGLGMLGCTPRLFGFWVSRIFGKGLGSVWQDSAIFSLGWGYVRISSTGFWLCNIIYIIVKVSMFKGLGYKMDSEYKVLVQFCRMLMKYKDFCLKIGPSLQNAKELQVIFICWIECIV
ncbi:hypothetical protein Tco_1037145, partial [Tanacetum coccineum]